MSAVGYALATGYDTPSPSIESVWDCIRRSVRTVTFYGRIEDIVFADEMKSDDPRHLEKAYWTLKNMSTLPDADRLYFNVAYATQAAWTSYRAWIKKDRQQRLATQNRIDEDLKFGLLPEVNGRKTNYGEDLTAYRLRLAMQNRNELKPANVAAADGNLDVVSFLARLEERQQAKDEAFLAALEALKKKAHENRPVDVTRVKYHGEKFRDSDNPFRWFRRWEQRAVSAKITDIDSMLAWLPQAISAEHAPVATHYVHTIESLGVPESVDELREQFIMAVTDEKARAPSTLYNVLLTMTWDPVVKQLKPYSLDFESAYTDLLDANKIEPHRKFEPTNQSLASAYWSSLGIADIRALTKDIDQNLPLKDVIRETLRIIDMTYDRGEPSVMTPVKAGSNVAIERKEVIENAANAEVMTITDIVPFDDAESEIKKLTLEKLSLESFKDSKAEHVDDLSNEEKLEDSKIDKADELNIDEAVQKAFVNKPRNWTSSRVTTFPGICIAYQSKTCHRQTCRFKHMCKFCAGHHPGSACERRLSSSNSKFTLEQPIQKNGIGPGQNFQ